MIRVLSFFTILGLLSVFSSGICCPIPRLSDVTAYPGTKEPKTLTLHETGIGKNEAEAITDASLNAFEQLLFRGIPDSDQPEALIGTNENEIRSKNSDYFNQFYKQRFGTFILSTQPTIPLQKLPKGKKRIEVDITINLNALKKDLEENNIIRKFGF